MKLSFSLSSKPSSKQNPKTSQTSFEDPNQNNQNTKPQYVTEFDSSETLTHKHSNHIIPPIENTWRPIQKMNNLDLPLRSSTDDPNLRFELEAPTTIGDTDTKISYGLTLRKKEDGTSSNGIENEKLGQKSEVSTSHVENLMLKRYKEDMENLPEDRGFDEFADCPVEDFGKAFLAAYGWKEGQGIGRNAKEEVKVIQYVRRGDKEGLGYEPQLNDPKKNKKKGGRNSGPDLVAPKGPDGRTRHVISIDEKLVPREVKGINVGKIVRVVDGRHLGLKGKVLEKFGSDSESSTKIVLKLLKSDEEVRVRVNEVAELGSYEDENCVRKLQESKNRVPKDDRRVDDKRDSSRSGKREKRDSDSNEKRIEKKMKGGSHENGESYKKNRESEPISWLRSHIRVRIVSKDFKGGKLYLKKGEVVDVVGPRLCDITMDESKELIQGVRQDILETALPRRGGPVLVLLGKHKGIYGNLVERDMEKETGVVRDADSHDLLNVQLEQIAEYIGDPSYIGY